jgi:4-amino-4-deoxy-L-arabinose transferase-like glycosyltransferase
MSSAKRKKSKHRKKKKTSRKISEVKGADLAGDSRQEIVFKYVLNGLLFIYLLYYLFQLYASLDNTFFWADENKHAYISSLILKNHQIPVILPEEMYGEFQWSYPPLFHIIGAVVQGAAGFPAIKYTNLILLLIFILSFFMMMFKYYGDTEAMIACLLISLAPVIAVNTIRFTVEMLSMLLTFLSFFFFLLAIRENKIHFAVFCGLSTGLLMLSKQTGFIVLSFYFLLLPWFSWKNVKKIKMVSYVIVVSLGIYVPYFIWAVSNEAGVFGFINLFMGKRPDWALLGAKSFQKYDSTLKEFASLFYKGAGFIVTLSLLLPLYYFIRKRLKDTPQIYVLILAIYLSAVMVTWHITNDRHIITLIPFIAFLFSYSLHQIVTRKIIIQGAFILLLIIAGYSTYHMPDYRQRYNRDGKDLMPLSEKLKEDHSSFSRILSVNKFDVLMYTRKPVIWPHPKLRKNPLDLFEKQNSGNLYSLLKSYQIKYVLINLNFVKNTDRFLGRNYPISLVRNFEQLERQGKLTLEAVSESKKFILLRVS